MPLVTKPFSDIITFTRASTGTFTGSDGLIQTATTNTPRFDYDPVTLAAKGLLIEEQRTNLLTYSDCSTTGWVGLNASGTNASAVSPNGTTTATLWTASVGGNNRVYSSASSLTSGTTYTASVYVKKPTSNAGRYLTIYVAQSNESFAGWPGGVLDLDTGIATGTGYSATALPNGWYRIVSTAAVNVTAICRVFIAITNASGVLTSSSNAILLWGAQLEAGSFATSYIPTVASQVTRSADVASVNTLSPWYNATEGTLYGEASKPALGGNASIATVFSATTLRMQIGNNTGGIGSATADFYVQNTGDQAYLTFAGAVTANVPFKISGAYSTNNFGASANGAATLIDTSGTVPNVASFLIGASGTTGNAFNGHIRRIAYYPRRLSNAELQTLTA